MTTTAPPFAGLPHTELPARLAAVAALAEIGAGRAGPGGFSPGLLAEAQELLERAGERLKLSAAHTVVMVAGGTGSGKSSVFNALAGATFSPVAVTRPATRHAHACVWGMQGAGPLLDWLGIERRYRYARASALDAGEAALNGLVLVDLPDHDSVAAGAASAVDRLISQADLMVWVLDPQKYADAAIHNRFLAPLARLAMVTTVALNQCDLLTAQQAEDCKEDLRRLLDSEGHRDARILLVSAATGAGLDNMRRILAGAVSARRAAAERIAADIDSIVAKFAGYATDPAAVARRAAAVSPGAGPPWDDVSPGGTTPATPEPPRQVKTALESVPAGPVLHLSDAFAHAAGLAAVTDALEDVREIRAARYLSWPFGRARWFPGRDPVRLGRAGGDGLAALSGGADVQQPEIDRAITAFAGAIGGTLPDPWPRTVRAAARSRAAEAGETLGAAVRESMPQGPRIPLWWRAVLAWQWLLAAMVVAGAGWIGVIIVAGAFHPAGPHPPELIGSLALIPWLAAMVVAMLLLGWLTASGSQNAVMLASDREREHVAGVMRARIDAVARDLVVIPAGTELTEYARFCTELTAATRSLTYGWAPRRGSRLMAGVRRRQT